MRRAYFRGGAVGLVCGAILMLAVIGAISLWDNDDESMPVQSGKQLVKDVAPKLTKADAAAKFWARLHRKPGDEIDSAFCEFLGEPGLRPYRYDCEVTYGGRNARRYDVEVAEVISGEFAHAVINTKRVPAR
jgi:hypothetical protein